MPASVVSGPGDTIPWPAYSKQIDYELELAVVIGSPAKCVSADEALDAVAGYYDRQRRVGPERDLQRGPQPATLGRVLRLAQRQVG
jgi:hypothetical protein